MAATARGKCTFKPADTTILATTDSSLGLRTAQRPIY